MHHDDSHSPKGSPFKPKRSNKFILSQMEGCMPVTIRYFDGTVSDDPCLFLRYNFKYWHNLLLRGDYSSILICPSVTDALSIWLWTPWMTQMLLFLWDLIFQMKADVKMKVRDRVVSLWGVKNMKHVSFCVLIYNRQRATTLQANRAASATFVMVMDLAPGGNKNKVAVLLRWQPNIAISLCTCQIFSCFH